MADLLFAVRNNFYLGAYQAAIQESQDLDNLSELLQIEKDCFVYRSYIALGSHDLVVTEITDDAPMALQAVKLFAQYSAGKVNKDTMLATVGEWMADATCASNAAVAVMAATMYAAEDEFVEALRCCHSARSLETLAISVHVLLAMNRPDKAEAQAKAMSAMDDDATLTQLAQAWVGIALGGGKVQEAAYIFQELGNKYVWTAKLHNWVAVCNMKMGNWEEAEKELLEAFSKNANDADTLANLVAVALHLGKSTSRYITQLRTTGASHASVKRMAAAEEKFAHAASAFA